MVFMQQALGLMRRAFGLTTHKAFVIRHMVHVRDLCGTQQVLYEEWLNQMDLVNIATVTATAAATTTTTTATATVIAMTATAQLVSSSPCPSACR